MRSGTTRVTIVGGGVAALEAMIALRRLAEERVAIELVAPTPEWSYRPLAVAEPFGLGEATIYDLVRIARDHGAAMQLCRNPIGPAGGPPGAHMGWPHARLRALADRDRRRADHVAPWQRDRERPRLYGPLSRPAGRARTWPDPTRCLRRARRRVLAAAVVRARAHDRRSRRRAGLCGKSSSRS